MNIGKAVNTIKKYYPSVSISRLRFLENEGLIKPKRTKGGTRVYSEKDIERIKKIIHLQEEQFYSLKAIKNNPELIRSNKNKQLVIKDYSKHDALKQSGLSDANYNDLIEYKFEHNQTTFTQNDVDRLTAFAYFYNLGLTAKNLSVLKSLSDRSTGFLESIIYNSEDSKDHENEMAIKHFTTIIGSYVLKDI